MDEWLSKNNIHPQAPTLLHILTWGIRMNTDAPKDTLMHAITWNVIHILKTKMTNVTPITRVAIVRSIKNTRTKVKDRVKIENLPNEGWVGKWRREHAVPRADPGADWGKKKKKIILTLIGEKQAKLAMSGNFFVCLFVSSFYSLDFHPEITSVEFV